MTAVASRARVDADPRRHDLALIRGESFALPMRLRGPSGEYESLSGLLLVWRLSWPGGGLVKRSDSGLPGVEIADQASPDTRGSAALRLSPAETRGLPTDPRLPIRHELEARAGGEQVVWMFGAVTVTAWSTSDA